jgi:hypothetical protein
MNFKLFRNRGWISAVQLGREVWKVARDGYCLLLAALIVADLARFGFKAVQYLHAPVLMAGVSPLDSFSEPSTAAAILKQEAESLLFDYTEARNKVWSSAASAGHDPRPTNNEGNIESNPSRFAGCVRGSAFEVARIRPLQELQTTVQDLNLDVYQKLLVVYSENHFDNELLDTFLRLLQVAPERPELLDWVRIALDSSQHCDRTAEVEEALVHTIRFHPTLNTASRLAALKESWEITHRVRTGA